MTVDVRTESMSLTSTDMATFVSAGFLRLDEVVPDEINGPALAEFRRGVSPVVPGSSPAASYPPGSPIQRLLSLPRIAGAIRSLVGDNPVLDQHNLHVRRPGERSTQRLHSDGVIDTRRFRFDIQLMYYPERIVPGMGGTLIIPGSHLRKINELSIARYQNLRGQVRVECPAGTVIIAHHGLWHCGRRNVSDTDRYMFQIRLGAAVPQVRLWDTSDISDPAISRILAQHYPWYEYAEGRLEIINRIKLWRRLTDDPAFDIDFWLSRMDETPEPIA